MYMAYDTNVYIHTCIHIAHVTAYTYAVICVAMSLCTHSATASPAPPLRHRLSVAVAAFFQAAMAGDTLTESAGDGSSVKAPSTPWPDLHPCFKIVSILASTSDAAHIQEPLDSDRLHMSSLLL